MDGQNILYQYIKDEFSEEQMKRLLADLSIWIPPRFYRRLPIILPYIVRDYTCRKNRETGEDEWGSANSSGFLRDDNSLIKGVVRSFPIKSSKIKQYNGKILGNGFVASHIWGKITINGKEIISNQHYMLNSFVPNLVWLPVQISKLTDIEGSVAQKTLQTISRRLYGDITLPEGMSNILDALVSPTDLPKFDINPTIMNYFEVSDEWLRKRISSLISEINAILSVKPNQKTTLNKIKTSRYLPTLRELPAESRIELNNWLLYYKTILESRARLFRKWLKMVINPH